MIPRIHVAIRICRSARGLTRAELACLCGLSASSISLIESGHRQVSIGSFAAIAKALDVPPVILATLAQDARNVEALDAGTCLAVLRWLAEA